MDDEPKPNKKVQEETFRLGAFLAAETKKAAAIIVTHALVKEDVIKLAAEIKENYKAEREIYAKYDNTVGVASKIADNTITEITIRDKDGKEIPMPKDDAKKLETILYKGHELKKNLKYKLFDEAPLESTREEILRATDLLHSMAKDGIVTKELLEEIKKEQNAEPKKGKDPVSAIIKDMRNVTAASPVSLPFGLSGALRRE